MTYASGEESVTGVIEHLERFERVGLGHDIRLVKSRVDPVSASSALCWLSWKIYPKNEMEGWTWENVYGYRVGQDGKEGWEMSIADNEVSGLLQRYPKIFSG